MRERTESAGESPQRYWYRVTSWMSVVAALFCIVVCTLLLGSYAQYKLSDPLNDPALVAFRERFAENTGDEALKQDIRALDLLARKAYFTRQHQIRTGGFLLLGGVVALLVLLNIADGLREKLPDPSGCAGLDAVWDVMQRRRKALAAGGAVLVVAALLTAVRSHDALTVQARANVPPPDAPAPAPAPSPGPGTETPPPSFPPREALLANCPSFRGAEGNGRFDCEGVPLTWNESAGSNILWKVPVPLPGMAAPVIWEDRVYVAGATREDRKVFCFNLADGALVWTGTYTGDPAASTEYEVFDAPEDLMYASATPVTDGVFVYALYANGELVCFDAKTGEHRWCRVLGNPEKNTYGLSNSPVLYEGSVVALFGGDHESLVRIEGATGKELWRSPRNDVTWASPIAIRTRAGQDLIITHGDPETVGWDPKTGKKIWNVELCSSDVAPTPVFADDRLFVSHTGSGLFAVEAATGEAAWTLDELEEGYFSDAQSMVCDGELVYQFYDEILSVVDATNGAIVYEHEIESDPSFASPVLVKDRLYLPGGTNTVVVRTGRTFEELARCSLTERTDVGLAVVDGRILCRTEKSLYCIAEP